MLGQTGGQEAGRVIGETWLSSETYEYIQYDPILSLSFTQLLPQNALDHLRILHREVGNQVRKDELQGELIDRRIPIYITLSTVPLSFHSLSRSPGDWGYDALLAKDNRRGRGWNHGPRVVLMIGCVSWARIDRV